MPVSAVSGAFFGENRGLPAAVGAGYHYAAEHGYRFCGRVDADGQHPVVELRRLLERVRSGACDVAVGSRFVSGEGYEERRYEATLSRQFGHFILRRLMRWRLERPMLDATSGLYAANERALPVLARPYVTGAPEVEGLIRLRDAGLVVEEVPVHMRERSSGESKLRGRKAFMLVITVGLTVFLGRRLRRSAPNSAPIHEPGPPCPRPRSSAGRAQTRQAQAEDRSFW